MQTVLLGLCVLACPAAIGLLTWMVLRSERPYNSGAAIQVDETMSQVEALRTEVELLKLERAAPPADSPRWM